MQVVHATFRAGEGKEAVELLETLGIDIEDYKLLESKSGDLLIINLLYGDTDVLLDNLTSRFDFEEDEERSLVIFTPDTVVPRNKKKLEKASFHATRESLITFAQSNSQIDFQYIMLVIVSAIITSLGLILNNVAVIVGSMVIAPMLGPILAITIGIVIGSGQLIKKGISAEIIGTVIAILVGFIIGLIIPDVDLTEALKIRMFPTLADLLIATSAGAASAYTLIRGQLKTGLVGVMVAASLLPVMGAIGIGISMANQTLILGGFLLLGGNFLGLILANMLVFYFEGLRPQMWHKFKAEKIIKKSLIFILIAVIILSIPLGILTLYQFYIEKPIEIVKSTIRDNLTNEWEFRIESVVIDNNIINVYMYAEPAILNKNLLESIKKQIQKILAREYNINFKIIPIEELSV
mgnify:CR=1 FL=1